MVCALSSIAIGAALAAHAAPLPASAAQAKPPQSLVEDFAGREPLTDEELAGQRGGFTWNGIKIGLGADLRTYLNGELVLHTILSWTADGAQTQQLVSGNLTPADAAQLQAGILSSGGISMRVGNQSVFLANQGQTAILHRTDGALQSVLINRASNIEARQEIDAVLDLDNFGQFQQDIINTRVMDGINDMLTQSMTESLNN
jgi:hypothetical protein